MKATNINTIEFTQQVAETIYDQIKWGGFDVFCSWGISKKMILELDGKSGLAIKVNGLLHKGWVIILLNEGSDTYEVYTSKYQKFENAELKEEIVYCDELWRVIDTIVETGNMTLEEYKENVNKEYK